MKNKEKYDLNCIDCLFRKEMHIPVWHLRIYHTTTKRTLMEYTVDEEDNFTLFNVYNQWLEQEAL